jgi:putative glutamine amidotransferase
MQPPVIGLTTYNQKNKSDFPIAALMHKYIFAIAEAGGAALLIPAGLKPEFLRSLFDRLDGILFTGGGDVEIGHYHGQPHPAVDSVDPLRDASELELVRLAVELGKPFLGICRGIQVVNVALGGTLYTHIPDQHPGAIKHNYDSGLEREYLAHSVAIEKDSRMAGIFGRLEFRVNSLHHQGILRLAPRLAAAGYAPDGLIEAVELSGHPFGLAVQWHPEWLTGYDHARRLLAAFVEAAGNKAG